MLLICTASSGKNLVLAQTLLEYAAEMSIAAELIDLTTWDIPLYTSRAGDPPKTVSELEKRFADANGYLFCAPEYNGSIPPVLTNVIAWISTTSDDFRAVFNGKPTAIATFSGGVGQKVLVAMRLQFSHLGCNVMGREIMTNPNRPFNEIDGRAVLEWVHSMGERS